ncbi:hypothetical protein N7539_005995 [Penicillium diatomitis]|uniref:Uncharacterized protein n=1 Tax=Penicillium diatomitis TaxID=2819901 RepID=A0A9W9X5H2_9EURO|nr:uncharacterized protein N7539_005995 [Penicillium diatomitis]KAJ5484199.1 hypothetical protein N7539_005995 [Penicillium diatomitis]
MPLDNRNLSSPSQQYTSTNLSQESDALDSTMEFPYRSPEFAKDLSNPDPPTHGEIVSDNPEYLPSTKFLQPHFLPDPSQRYIDSTFRLLRHDIFGSAKDVLRDQVQQNNLTRFSFFSSKNSGAHLYLGAQMLQIFINERKELEATPSFVTPPQVGKKNKVEDEAFSHSILHELRSVIKGAYQDQGINPFGEIGERIHCDAQIVDQIGTNGFTVEMSTLDEIVGTASIKDWKANVNADEASLVDAHSSKGNLSVPESIPCDGGHEIFMVAVKPGTQLEFQKDSKERVSKR